MEKTKTYYQTRFAAAVLKDAHATFLADLSDLDPSRPPVQLRVSVGDETWGFDSVEDFLSACLTGEGYRFDHYLLGKARMYVENHHGLHTHVAIQAPTRETIERVFAVFERHVPDSAVILESEPITVYIGHGHAPEWRDLKDHLQDLHGITVVAYESGPRAGLSVKEVLEQLTRASFALLVLTGEDLHADGTSHARENVIHELGLFQGRLGFTRAIALLEEDVPQFSNILGVNHLRFAKGRIRETFGDVLATIKREFGRTV